MHSKKAFELSINFLVVVIISLVVLGFGIKFASKLTQQASDIQKKSTEQLDAEIGDILCGFDKVCVNPERILLNRGKSGLIGIKITNIFSDAPDKNFGIAIDSPDKCFVGKDGNAKEYTATEKNKCFDVALLNGNAGDRTINIKSKESASIGIGAVANKKAEAGTYIFNLKIGATGQTGDYYVGKLYVEVK